jgi:hypothetical protein
VVDVDGDGDLDLLVAALGSSPNNARIGAVLVLENDGRQRFATRTLVDRVARDADARAADLDGDGDLDVAWPASATTTVIPAIETGGGVRAHVLQRLSAASTPCRRLRRRRRPTSYRSSARVGRDLARRAGGGRYAAAALGRPPPIRIELAVGGRSRS